MLKRSQVTLSQLFEILREKLPPWHNLYSTFKLAPQLERSNYETRSFIMICEKSFEAIEIAWVKVRSGLDFDSSKRLLTSTYNRGCGDGELIPSN